MKTERQLRSTERREAMVFRQLPIAVYEVQTAGHGVVRSFLHDDSVKRLLGFTVADFEKDVSLWSERVHPEDWEMARGALAKREAGGAYSAAYRQHCGDDTSRYFLAQGLVVPDDTGGPHRTSRPMSDTPPNRAP